VKGGIFFQILRELIAVIADDAANKPAGWSSHLRIPVNSSLRQSQFPGPVPKRRPSTPARLRVLWPKPACRERAYRWASERNRVPLNRPPNLSAEGRCVEPGCPRSRQRPLRRDVIAVFGRPTEPWSREVPGTHCASAETPDTRQRRPAPCPSVGSTGGNTLNHWQRPDHHHIRPWTRLKHFHAPLAQQQAIHWESQPARQHLNLNLLL